MKRCKLGELIDINRGMSLAGEFYSNEGDLIRLTLGNFNYEDGFKDNNSKEDIFYIGPVKKEFILNKNDIITPLTEQTPGLLGSTARIPEGNKYIASGDVAIVKPDSRKIDESFCYYLMSSPLVKEQLNVTSQQTKIRHTSPDKIKDVTVFIPDLTIQRKIGNMLDSITFKIENNIKINQELESMIYDIFDYWFLQFNFPDENNAPYKSSGGELNWCEELNMSIPKDWIIDYIGSGISSSIIKPGIDTFDNEKIYIATADVSNFNITNSQTLVTFNHRPNRANMQPIEKSIWFAKMVGSRKIIIVDDYSKELLDNYIFSTGFCGIECNEIYYYYLASFILNDNFERIKNYLCAGSTMQAVNNTNIKLIKFALPDKNTLNMFNSIVGPLFKKIYFNSIENDNLKKLREFLIPLFMNGQVGFKD